MNRPLLRAVFAGTLVLIAAKGYCRTQVNVSSVQRPEVYQPVADPAAVVTLEHARFTVLTPQLIRMEWAADSKFEDHASFAFLNRRLRCHRSIGMSPDTEHDAFLRSTPRRCT